MPKKPKEAEDQEVEVQSSEVKKETFVTHWFNDNVTNNKEEMKIICDLTARSAERQFCIYLKTGNTETYAAVFFATFLTILDYLKSKQKTYNNFTCEICNSINIGYTNNDDENNEKVGNFMPIMEYIGINRNIVDSSEVDVDKTEQNLLRWKELNVKKNIEAIKEIQEKAYEKLVSEFKIGLRTSEAIIPLFCIFMDNISSTIKLKYQEVKGTDISEVSMNVLNLFDVYYSYDEEEDKEIIDYQPNIRMKLFTKSDDIASRE